MDGPVARCSGPIPAQGARFDSGESVRGVRKAAENVARRPNYGFVKREKEIKRQKKKAEKAELKRLKKVAANGDPMRESTDDDATGSTA
jgi:hypothetical protein